MHNGVDLCLVQDALRAVLNVVYSCILFVFSVTILHTQDSLGLYIECFHVGLDGAWCGLIFSISGPLHCPHPSIIVFFHLYVALVHLSFIHPPFPLPPPNCLMSYSHHLYTLFFSQVKFAFALFLSLICPKLPWPCLSVSFHNVTVQCTIKAPCSATHHGHTYTLCLSLSFI